MQIIILAAPSTGSLGLSIGKTPKRALRSQTRQRVQLAEGGGRGNITVATVKLIIGDCSVAAVYVVFTHIQA